MLIPWMGRHQVGKSEAVVRGIGKAGKMRLMFLHLVASQDAILHRNAGQDGFLQRDPGCVIAHTHQVKMQKRILLYVKMQELQLDLQ